MADAKISALTGATTPLAGTEVLPIVQSGSTVKVAVSNLTAGRSVSMLGLEITNSGATGGVLRLSNSDTDQTVGDVIGKVEYFSADADDPEVKAFVRAVVLDSFGRDGYLSFGTTATGAAVVERMIIGTAGVVTMSAYGVGTATFSAAGVISSVSDETWKIKDGIPADPIAMLKQLEPGYWFYNEEKGKVFGKDRQLGFYAQNVNKAIGPEAAPPPEEGKPWGYYDRSVLAVTVMSLQKALATIESLTARIAALEVK
jgi:hypothetical protein